MPSYARYVLAERPETFINDKTFRKEIAELPAPESLQPNEVLVKVEHLSLDPAMRGWLRDTRSYVPPVKIGETMRAQGLGTVVATGKAVKGFQSGDKVEGTFGWAEYAVLPEKHVQKRVVPRGAKLTDFLGALGMTGQTAYWGIIDVGKIRAGETVVVSGAAGAVGSIVCQIAKLRGCKVIAIAGGEDKCRWLEDDLSIKAFNYKDPDFYKKFKSVGYLDVYCKLDIDRLPTMYCSLKDHQVDNVGGDMLDFMLTRLNQGARIALCGAISQYNTTKPKGLQAYLNLISQRARIEGFIVFDYKDRYAEAEREMAQWIQEGKLKTKETVVYGLDSCIRGLQGIFKGENTGKMIVSLDKTPSAHL